MWSTPRRVVKHLANSYRLKTLDGAQLEGEFSVRRLREFVPQEGTDLAEAQKEHMKKVVKEEGDQRKKEEEEVNNMRKTEGEHAAEVEYKGADIIGPDFVYEEEDEEIVEEEEEEDKGIAGRVVRRRGCRH